MMQHLKCIERHKDTPQCPSISLRTAFSRAHECSCSWGPQANGPLAFGHELYNVSWNVSNGVVTPACRAAQVGFGSGFKCNSAVWRALRPISGVQHDAWAHIGATTTAPMWDNLRAPCAKPDATARLNGATPLPNGTCGHAAPPPAS